jgi:hypothetical protein
VRDPRDLNPATTSIADELSRQYYLGYPALGKKDGRWHAIRVELRDGSRGYRIRARRGYVASKFALALGNRPSTSDNPQSAIECRVPLAATAIGLSLLGGFGGLLVASSLLVLPRQSATGSCRGWSATPSARCSALPCSSCCRRRCARWMHERVLFTLLVGILSFFVLENWRSGALSHS